MEASSLFIHSPQHSWGISPSFNCSVSVIFYAIRLLSDRFAFEINRQPEHECLWPIPS